VTRGAQLLYSDGPSSAKRGTAARNTARRSLSQRMKRKISHDGPPQCSGAGKKTHTPCDFS
jgi:hypothetical protein